MNWCDAHYSFDCGCDNMGLDGGLGEGYPPTLPIPSTVYVAVALYTKSVVVRTGQTAATAPITGKMSIFERGATTVRETFRAEVICVGTRAECEMSVQLARQEGVEFSITEHRVGLERGVTKAAGPILSVPCRGGCGRTTDLTGICQPCREKQWKEQREAFAASGGVQE